MDLKMSGHVAVVCGGSTGIGFATALCFLQEGCSVAICSRSSEKLNAAKQALSAHGYPDVYAESVDMTDESAVYAFAAHVAEKFGTIHYWANVVGGSMPRALNQATSSDFDRAVAMNFKSAFYGCNAAAKYMKPQRYGAIVNVASMAHWRPAAGRTLYGANKAALIQMTKGFAAELSPFNIRVNSVSPGLVMSEMSRPFVPEEGTEEFHKFFKEYLIKRPGEAREVGEPIVLLCSPAFGFTTATDIKADGGVDAVYELPWVYEHLDLLEQSAPSLPERG